MISLTAFSQHLVCPIFFKAIVFSTTLLSSSAVSGTQDSFNHCTQSGDICCHKRTECDMHPFHPTPAPLSYGSFQNALTSTEMCVAVLYLPESAFTFLQLTTHNSHMFNTVASSQTVQCTSKTNLWPPIMQSSFFWARQACTLCQDVFHATRCTPAPHHTPPTARCHRPSMRASQWTMARDKWHKMNWTMWVTYLLHMATWW